MAEHKATLDDEHHEVYTLLPEVASDKATSFLYFIGPEVDAVWTLYLRVRA